MSYITLSDIQNALDANDLIQLTDDTGAGTLASGIVNACIERAEGWMNGYLERIYETPLGSPGWDVKDLCINKTIILLKSRRSAMSEYWEKKEKDIGDKAEKISSGEIKLSGQPDEQLVAEGRDTIESGRRKCNIWDSDADDYTSFP